MVINKLNAPIIREEYDCKTWRGLGLGTIKAVGRSNRNWKQSMMELEGREQEIENWRNRKENKELKTGEIGKKMETYLYLHGDVQTNKINYVYCKRMEHCIIGLN